MITVIIDGTDNIERTLTSLISNAKGAFRAFVDESVRVEMDAKFTDMIIEGSSLRKVEFVEATLLRKYGKRSKLYWAITSGSLVLVSEWDTRLLMCVRSDRLHCLSPSGGSRNLATNRQFNVGRWRGECHIVPRLTVTEF